MITQEIQEKIDEELEKIAEKISKELSILPTCTLTESWDYARVYHPILYNFIKEWIPIYDTEFFTPIKRLLEGGRIPAMREAIERLRGGASEKIVRARFVKLLILTEDCYHAMLNTAQAVLMFIGIDPPISSKAYDYVKKFLVEPGLLEHQYAESLKQVIRIRKRIEEGKIRNVSSICINRWIKRAEKFVGRMFKILNVLEVMKRREIAL